MATKRYVGCGIKEHKVGVPKLFNALHDISMGKKYPQCNQCDKPMNLRLEFPFALEAGTAECKVIDAFFPDNILCYPIQNDIKFYPFLVVQDRQDSEQHRAIWLPYWHKITDRNGQPTLRYSQYAPWMGNGLFNSLVSKARAAGLIP